MKSTKRILSLLLVLAMVFSLAVPAFAEGETPATLVSWSGGTSVVNNGENDVLSDVSLAVDAVANDSTLSNHKITTSTYGNLSATPWYGTDYYQAGTQYAYVEFAISTKGYENLNLKTVFGGNARVPTAYALSYSLDGTTWTAVEGAITATAKNTLADAATSNVVIPAEAADKDSVTFRIAQTEGAHPKTEGGSGTNAGSLYIYSVEVTGTAVAGDPIDPPEVKELDGKTVILHSNDVHGAIEGYANIAALKAEYEAKGAEVILADAGDYSQGTVNVSSTKGLDAIKMMNAAGYDVATIGNHEFDYGYEQLKTNAAAAEFKMICADVLEDGKTILDANVIIEKDGVKIGFFGLETPEAQTKANPALIKGLTFLAGDQLYACAQEQVAALKEQGADIVICLAHLGVDAESAPNRSVDLAAKVEGIDFIIDGHSHTVMTAGPNGEVIQSTGTAFKNVGVIVIDNASKKIESNKLVEITAETAKDETVAAAAKVIIDRIDAEYGEVFAKSEVDLNGAKAPNGNRDSETNLGDLITDSMLWTVLKDEGSISVPVENVVAITNGGGIRAPIAKGDITKKDVNTVLPFGNTIAVVYVTGAELLEALEASTYCTPTAVGGFPQVAGIEFNIDTDKEYDANEDTYPGSTYHGPASFNRVTVLSVNGMPFYLDETYAVVTNNFLAAGGDTYYAFSAASAQFDTGIPMDEALMAYITEELGGVVGEEYAEPQGRITIGHMHNFVNGICEDCGLEMEGTFTDVKPGAWYFDAVEIAAAVGLVNGRTEDTFVPNANMTRAEFATILYRLAGEESMGELKVSFKDIKGSEWYADTVLWAASWGLVNGYPDGTFKPNGTITRQEIAIMLMRFNDLVVDSEETVDTSVLKEFADGAKVPNWSKEAMAWAVNEGIIQGMDGNKLAPTGLATRAQVATMVVRYLLTIDA